MTAKPKTIEPAKRFGRGWILQPTFSPDGSQVAFIWNGENQDNFDVYVKVIGSAEPRRLTFDPASDGSPSWSPDGRRIAFLRELPGGLAEIRLISPTGVPSGP